MKRVIFGFILIAALLVGAAPITRAQAQDLSLERAAVEQALHAFFDAAQTKNWASVDSMLASDFQFYSDSALTLDKAAFIAAMKDDDMDVGQLALQDVTVALSNEGDFAWVKYRAHLESTIKGRPYNMMSVETVIFRKERGGWKMVHNHASIKGL